MRSLLVVVLRSMRTTRSYFQPYSQIEASQKENIHIGILSWMFHRKSLRVTPLFLPLSTSSSLHMSLLCLMKTGISSVVLMCLHGIPERGTLQMKRQCVGKLPAKVMERWHPAPQKGTDVLDEETPPVFSGDSRGCITQVVDGTQNAWKYSKDSSSPSRAECDG